MAPVRSNMRARDSHVTTPVWRAGSRGLPGTCHGPARGLTSIPFGQPVVGRGVVGGGLEVVAPGRGRLIVVVGARQVLDLERAPAGIADVAGVSLHLEREVA